VAHIRPIAPDRNRHRRAVARVRAQLLPGPRRQASRSGRPTAGSGWAPLPARGGWSAHARCLDLRQAQKSAATAPAMLPARPALLCLFDRACIFPRSQALTVLLQPMLTYIMRTYHTMDVGGRNWLGTEGRDRAFGNCRSASASSSVTPAASAPGRSAARRSPAPPAAFFFLFLRPPPAAPSSWAPRSASTSLVGAAAQWQRCRHRQRREPQDHYRPGCQLGQDARHVRGKPCQALSGRVLRLGSTSAAGAGPAAGASAPPSCTYAP